MAATTDRRRRGSSETGARTGRRRRWVSVALIGVAVLAVVSAASVATDESSFCNTCHEMGPFYTAWRQGAHAEQAECIDCHVDSGLLARFAHKPQALREVVAHFRGDVSFPLATPPELPDVRCLRCHEEVEAGTASSGFSHEAHAEQGDCTFCHPDTGHAVTEESLAAAGVFDEAQARTRADASVAADVVARPGAGSANLEGHPDIRCSGCHDLAATGCAACHAAAVTAEHEWDSACADCHTSPASWAFSHPEGSDCGECHEAPAGDGHPPGDDCRRCHSSASSWQFKHPDGSSRCSDCHARPDEDDHPDRDDCFTCHSLGGEWDHDK